MEPHNNNADEEMTSLERLRNMFLPVKPKDSWEVKLIKDSVFYMVGLMLVLGTLLLFVSVLFSA
jgi:hypothetical protein